MNFLISDLSDPYIVSCALFGLPVSLEIVNYGISFLLVLLGCSLVFLVLITSFWDKLKISFGLLFVLSERNPIIGSLNAFQIAQTTNPIETNLTS